MFRIDVKKTVIGKRTLALLAAGLVAATMAAPTTVRAQPGDVPGTLLEFYGLMKLRQICYSRCADELDQAEKECTAKYVLFSSEWQDCMGDALGDYYQCTEDCPPFQKIIDNPFSDSR